MTQYVRSTALVALFFVFGCVLAGCGGGRSASTGGGTNSGTSSAGENTASQLTELKCGNTTYRLSAAKIDREVNEACDRVNKSHESDRASRAARTRFTCQDSKGHIVESRPVPNALLEDYNKSCREYLSTDAQFENGTADRTTHFDALKRFQSETNQLTKQSVDEANANWRQNRSDQASLNTLIKNRGGSIEIAD
jgi:hypothetical protein